MKQAVLHDMADLQYSAREAMNIICSNLSFSGRDVRKIILTSCNAGDGKSFMCMYMAQNMAGRGKKVVLVDADLRRSNLVSRYGFRSEDGTIDGLAHYLAGLKSLDDVLYQTNFENMTILPAGRGVANPLPLIDSPAFADLLNELALRFDIVLVDAPPVGLVIDAAEIARYCDGAVLVVKYKKTKRKELSDVKNQLRQAGCPILGCVLNNVTFDSISSKRYYNKSYYSHYGYAYRYSPDTKK